MRVYVAGDADAKLQFVAAGIVARLVYVNAQVSTSALVGLLRNAPNAVTELVHAGGMNVVMETLMTLIQTPPSNPEPSQAIRTSASMDPKALSEHSTAHTAVCSKCICILAMCVIATNAVGAAGAVVAVGTAVCASIRAFPGLMDTLSSMSSECFPHAIMRGNAALVLYRVLRPQEYAARRNATVSVLLSMLPDVPRRRPSTGATVASDATTDPPSSSMCDGDCAICYADGSVTDEGVTNGSATVMPTPVDDHHIVTAAAAATVTAATSKVYLPCWHTFHKTCIEACIQELKRDKCPICATPILGAIYTLLRNDVRC